MKTLDTCGACGNKIAARHATHWNGTVGIVHAVREMCEEAHYNQTDLAVFCGYQWHRVTHILRYRTSPVADHWGRVEDVREAVVETDEHTPFAMALTAITHVDRLGGRVELDPATPCAHPFLRARS